VRFYRHVFHNRLVGSNPCCLQLQGPCWIESSKRLHEDCSYHRIMLRLNMIGFVSLSQLLEWFCQFFGMPKVAYHQSQGSQQFVVLEFHIAVHKQGFHLWELLEESIIKGLCKCLFLHKNSVEALFKDEYL